MRVLGKLLAVVILLGAAYAVFAWTWGVPRVAEHPTLTDEESIARGRYLLVAGDCISCHTAPGAATLSGGFEVASPFGNIVAPNITPAKSGIAGMTSAQFYQIMAYGANSIWHPLYPAMPYTSFRLVTREDSDALHGYLMSLPPVENDVPPTSLMFPFNIRPGVFAWNLLFADRGTFVPDPAKDEAWNRGAYLVNGLGHCDACHTPRNMLMGEKSGEALKGGRQGAMIAPDITADGLIARGWTFDLLVSYFTTGNGPRASSFGEMAQVIRNTTSQLTPEDRAAMASYLFDGKSAPAAEPATDMTLDAAVGAGSDGKSLYLGNCALCHKATGEGIANTTPPLAGNSTVLQADGRNLVVVTADGLAASQMVPGTGVAALGPMPAFRSRLTLAEMTAVANYVRTTFGDGTVPELSEEEVKAILDGK
ncbi:MAG: cytochrome c [Rhodobacteraceae bacterium]|nr:cytochrome c [Paracoccaceae bacterium]